jgi:hypothetical protein
MAVELRFDLRATVLDLISDATVDLLVSCLLLFPKLGHGGCVLSV